MLGDHQAAIFASAVFFAFFLIFWNFQTFSMSLIITSFKTLVGFLNSRKLCDWCSVLDRERWERFIIPTFTWLEEIATTFLSICNIFQRHPRSFWINITFFTIVNWNNFFWKYWRAVFMQFKLARMIMLDWNVEFVSEIVHKEPSRSTSMLFNTDEILKITLLLRSSLTKLYAHIIWAI